MSSKVYVVFEGDEGHWWSRFLHPVIKHCYVIKPCDFGVVVNGKTTEGIELFTVLDEKSIIGNDYIIVGYKPEKLKKSLFVLNTCVGHTKQILNISNPFILTPYQLYKYMRHQNESAKSS